MVVKHPVGSFAVASALVAANSTLEVRFVEDSSVKAITLYVARPSREPPLTVSQK